MDRQLKAVPLRRFPNGDLNGEIPSGKTNIAMERSTHLMGKSTISMAIFNSKLLVFQRVNMVKTLDLDWKSLAPNDDLNGINQMISDDLRVSPRFF